MVSSECDDGDTHLVGGPTQYEGMVEVCVNKAWGSICGYADTGWGDEEARIVCTQIGALSIGN